VDGEYLVKGKTVTGFTNSEEDAAGLTDVVPFLVEDALKANEAKRVSLYKNVAALVRKYANIANEIQAAGYSASEAKAIKAEVEHFSQMRQEIKLASKDEVDMKQYEPGMRRLLDSFVRANDSVKVVDF